MTVNINMTHFFPCTYNQVECGLNEDIENYMRAIINHAF